MTVAIAAFLPDPDKRYVEYAIDMSARDFQAFDRSQQASIVEWMLEGLMTVAIRQEISLDGVTLVGLAR